MRTTGPAVVHDGIGRATRYGLCCLAIVVLGACDGSDEPTHPSADDRVTVPVTVATAPSEQPRLTGFGATREAWEALHHKAPGFMDGTAYMPLVGGKHPYYSRILWEQAQPITTYGLTFEEGNTLEQVKEKVLREFPPGATFDRVNATDPRCLIMRIHSPEVEQVVSGGKPMVAMFSTEGPDTKFRPDDVRFAILVLTLDARGNNFGGC